MNAESQSKPLDVMDVFEGLSPQPAESLYFSVSENAPKTSGKPSFSSLLYQSRTDLEWTKDVATAASQRISRQISLEAASSQLVQIQFHIHEVLLQLTSHSECQSEQTQPFWAQLLLEGGGQGGIGIFS